MGGRHVDNFRGEVLEGGAKLLIFLADFRQLGVDGVQGVVMATMPETVAQRMERMDPSPAVMVWSA